MKLKLLSAFVCCVSCHFSFSQTITIPDANFKNYLVSNTLINSNGDTEIQASEASAFSGEIDCSNVWTITSLTGIEAFTALTSLRAQYNPIESINLSSNTALTYLNIGSTLLTSIDLSANTALTYLDVSGAQLTDLSLINNGSLTELNCSTNLLTSLNLSYTPQLITLNCSTNDFTTLDLSPCPLLQNLTIVYHANLQSLDVSANTALVNLDCHYNNIATLTLGTHPSLTTFNCTLNPVNGLNLSGCPALTTINCGGTMEELDLSACTALTYVFCSGHDLHTFNIQNGHNNIITNFMVSSPNLSCILVDDVAYSTAHWTEVDATYNHFRTVCEDIVYIPDDNLRNYLRGDTANIDTNNDNWIQYSEAAAVTGILDCHGMDIANATGLEAFTAITSLDLRNNLLTHLDISSNTALTVLDCGTNDLASLEIGAENAALQELYCSYNQLQTLTLSAPLLTTLNCQGNQLTSLNIPSEIELGLLDCHQNLLTSLQFNTDSITSIECSNNQLTSLNFDGNTTLTGLVCNNNLLTSLSVNGCSSLTSLECQYNNLTTLDCSSVVLEWLHCNNNNLAQLNLKNGSTASLLNFNFDAKNNPGLTCIQVNNVLTSNYFLSNYIDATANFSTDCGYNNVYIPDADFLASLVANPAINTDGNNAIDFTEAAAFTGTINCSGLQIANLTGIEAFTGITGLNCSDNLLTSLNVSSNTALTSLDCSGNTITQLITGKSATPTLVLDVSNNLNLQYLDCSGNMLTVLDVSNNTALISLDCSGNSLTSLNVANGNNSNFIFFNSTQNENLACVTVDNTQWSQQNWTNIDIWTNFSQNCDLAGIAEMAQTIALYPNPASSKIYVNLGNGLHIDAIGITDVSGKKIALPENGDHSLNVEKLASGLYMVNILCGGKAYTAKFIKD